MLWLELAVNWFTEKKKNFNSAFKGENEPKTLIFLVFSAKHYKNIPVVNRVASI